MKNKEEVKVALESGIYTFDIPIKKSELVELIYQAYRQGRTRRASQEEREPDRTKEERSKADKFI